jgi:hypothetical protein
MDKSKQQLGKCQTGFIDFLCAPLYQLLAQALGDHLGEWSGVEWSGAGWSRVAAAATRHKFMQHGTKWSRAQSQNKTNKTRTISLCLTLIFPLTLLNIDLSLLSLFLRSFLSFVSPPGKHGIGTSKGLCTSEQLEALKQKAADTGIDPSWVPQTLPLCMAPVLRHMQENRYAPL